MPRFYATWLNSPKNEVRLPSTLFRAPNAFPLNNTIRFPKTCSVDKSDRITSEIKMHLDYIPGCSCFLSDNGNVPAGDCIQQARLAGIGSPHQHHLQAGSQTLTAPGFFQVIGNFPLERGSLFPDFIRDTARNILFISEIEIRFNHRPHVYEPLAPILIERSEGAAHLADSLFALAFRFSSNEIRKALHLGQVHPAPVKGSACELSRFGRAAVWKLAQHAKHRRDNSPTTVALKLDNIFTGETCRPLKEKDKSLINSF